MTETWAVNPPLKFGPLFSREAAWVKNMITGITQPYILSRATSDATKALTAGKLSANQLEPSIAGELKDIGIVYDRPSLQDQKNLWNLHLETARTELQQRPWTVVRSLYNRAGAPAFRAWANC